MLSGTASRMNIDALPQVGFDTKEEKSELFLGSATTSIACNTFLLFDDCIVRFVIGKFSQPSMFLKQKRRGNPPALNESPCEETHGIGEISRPLVDFLAWKLDISYIANRNAEQKMPRDTPRLRDSLLVWKAISLIPQAEVQNRLYANQNTSSSQ